MGKEDEGPCSPKGVSKGLLLLLCNLQDAAASSSNLHLCANISFPRRLPALCTHGFGHSPTTPFRTFLASPVPRDASREEAKGHLWGGRLQCQRGLGEVLQPILVPPSALCPHLVAIIPAFPILEHSSLSFLTIPPLGWQVSQYPPNPRMVMRPQHPYTSAIEICEAGSFRLCEQVQQAPGVSAISVGDMGQHAGGTAPRQHSLSSPISTGAVAWETMAKCGQGSRGVKGGEEMPAPSTCERDGLVEISSL